ncbi:MAG: HD family phosphohydrolase [Tyzzerella sp.]|nr:HD family phosphohydrolase [Tyzzerella sp.]
MREKIKRLLLSTKRDGIISLLTWMELNGYYEAPCSTQHHLCKEGGLAEHSWNVFDTMDKLAGTIVGEKGHDDLINSIIICSLLHDIGKCGRYGKRLYVENYLTKKDKKGNPIRSETKPYVTNPELLNVPHEIRSVSIIEKFIDLTEDEYYAILYHNGLYGDLKYQISGKETELYMLLHFADMWASRVVEVKKEEIQPE